MAIASTPTRLPLARFARILGVHPLHFEGVAYTPTSRSPELCDSAIQQYDWQEQDRVSREGVAMAIAEAEALLEAHLGYRLAPTWEVAEWARAERPYVPEHVLFGVRDIRGFSLAVKARWGQFISGGIEATSFYGNAIPIVWSDEDGDGYFETGTVTFPVVAGTDPAELELHYPDAAPAAPQVTTQIRPLLSADVSGATATLTFRRELAVKREILDALTPTHATATDDADFLDEVAAFRRYNDPSVQATLLWEPVATNCGVCQGSGSGCAACAYAAQTACIHLRSLPRYSQLGFTPAEWNTDNGSFDALPLALSRAPDAVRLYYRAGLRASPGVPYGFVDQMPAEWERIVAYLAVSMLDRPLCGCTAAIWDYWRSDFAVAQGAEDAVTYFASASGDDLANPFGTRRGALHAWRWITKAPDVANMRSAVAV